MVNERTDAGGYTDLRLLAHLAVTKGILDLAAARIWSEKAEILERGDPGEDGEARALAQAYRTWARQFSEAAGKATGKATAITPPVLVNR
jgi:hypothetical protein